MIKQLKISLKKQVKLMGFYLTNQKKKITTTLDMLLLKMEAEVKGGLAVLVGQIFQISLRIFLGTLEAAEEVLEEEILIIEDPI